VRDASSSTKSIEGISATDEVEDEEGGEGGAKLPSRRASGVRVGPYTGYKRDQRKRRRRGEKAREMWRKREEVRNNREI